MLSSKNKWLSDFFVPPGYSKDCTVDGTGLPLICMVLKEACLLSGGTDLTGAYLNGKCHEFPSTTVKTFFYNIADFSVYFIETIRDLNTNTYLQM